MSITEKSLKTTSRRRVDPSPPPLGGGRIDSEQAPEDTDVGHRLRSLRKRCGLSIRQLAEHAKVTAGIISCVERGKHSPSIATLQKIVTALGSNLATFFSKGSMRQEGPIFHRERMQDISDGARHYTIVLGDAKGVEVEIFDEQICPDRELPEFEKLECDIYGYLLSGAILMEIENRPPETLRPGDAFFIPRGQTHRGYAVGEETARLITVYYPRRY